MRSVLLFTLASVPLGRLPAVGQPHLALAATSNSSWMDSVQRLPLARQVEAVRARSWRDTLLAPYQLPLCRLGLPAAPRGSPRLRA